MSNSDNKKLFRLVSGIVLVLIVIVFTLQNNDLQTVHFIFWKTEMPVAFALFLSFLLGLLVAGISLFPGFRRASKAEDKINELREKVNALELKLDKPAKKPSDFIG
jgi:uncharacterized integral membrane protein